MLLLLLFLQMRALAFDMKGLEKAHLEYKAKEKVVVATTLADHLSVLLNRAKSIDMTVCKKAWREHYIKYGAFDPNINRMPSECVTEELNMPFSPDSGAIDQSQLRVAFGSAFPGFELFQSGDIYSDGPRILVKPTFSAEEQTELDKERTAAINRDLAKQEETIRAIVPQLIEKANNIDVKKCSEAYIAYYTKYGRFPHWLADCATESIKIPYQVDLTKVQAKFKEEFRSTDGRIVDVAIYNGSFHDSQSVKAYISPSSFNKN